LISAVPGTGIDININISPPFPFPNQEIGFKSNFNHPKKG